MKTIEYRATDKSAWCPGPWQDEPDKRQFVDETGLPCLIVRGPSGALCGYVGVSKSHPIHGVSYSDDESQNPVAELDVHGGVTFTDFCQPGREDSSVCHLVEDGEDDAVWWIGFDCAHYGDFLPSRRRRLFCSEEEEYRDIGYVTREIARLARQIKDVEGAR